MFPDGLRLQPPGLSWGGGRSEVQEEDWAKPGPGDMSAALRPSSDPAQKGGDTHGLLRCARSDESTYLAVGITNSAPLPIDSGQRCMMDFCLV